MSNQEILNMLADAECEIFHLSSDNPEDVQLKEAHKAARAALESFAKAIGALN